MKNPKPRAATRATRSSGRWWAACLLLALTTVLSACTGSGQASPALPGRDGALVGMWVLREDPSQSLLLDAAGSGSSHTWCPPPAADATTASDTGGDDASGGEASLSWATGAGSLLEVTSDVLAGRWAYVMEGERLVLAANGDEHVLLAADASPPTAGHPIAGVWSDMQHGGVEDVFHANGTGMRTVGSTTQLFTWAVGPGNLLRLCGVGLGAELWTYAHDGVRLTLDSRQVPGLTRTLISARLPQ